MALLLAARLSRVISKPITALATAAKDVEGGNLATRAPVAGAAEVIQVATEFNRMLDARAHAESKRREAERRFRDMLAGVELAAVILDTRGRIIYCNDFLLRLTGWQLEEIAGQDWFARFLPAESGEAKNAFLHMLKGETLASHYENEIVARSGARRLIRWSNTILRSPEGEVAGTASIGEDITDRKRAEMLLRESEAKLRKLIDGLGPSMYVGLLTPDGVIVEANRSALAAAGLEVEDVIGKAVEDSYWFSGSEHARSQLRAVIDRAAAGEASRFDVQTRVAEGRTAWLDFSLQPLRDDTGRIVHLVPSAMVIDDRKRAELAVLESEERFRQLTGSIREVFWLTDTAKATMLYVSPAYEAIWGRTCDSLYASPRDWLDAIHPEDRERILQAAQSKQMSGTYDEEYRIVRPDGALRWIRDWAFPVRDASGAVDRIAGVAEDITERRRVEEALRDTDEKLRLFVQYAPAAIAMFDREMRYIAFSRRWLRDYKIADADIIGHSHYEVFPDLPEHWRGVHRRCLAGATESADEEAFPRGDGSVDWVRWEVHPWHAGEGSIGGIIIFSEVITMRKRAQQALHDSKAMLEAHARRLLEVQESERRLIARELHDEVGGALTAVKLNLQSLRGMRAGDSGAALADGLALVDGVLQSVRSLSLDLRPAMLDDLGLIPALRWYCERQARRSGVAIELAMDAIDLKAAPLLESACYRIVQEALTNALRHADAHLVQVALRLGGGGFTLEIVDDGCGFDVAAARRRELAGESGGLLGMEERTRLLGGRFEIHSAPRAGTRVRAEFTAPVDGLA